MNTTPDGDFGEYTRHVLRQWARNPTLGDRLTEVRRAVREGRREALLEHLWSEDAGHVLAELHWLATWRPLRRVVVVTCGSARNGAPRAGLARGEGA